MIASMVTAGAKVRFVWIRPETPALAPDGLNSVEGEGRQWVGIHDEATVASW